jgi:hypothetical protein
MAGGAIMPIFIGFFEMPRRRAGIGPRVQIQPRRTFA